MRLHLTLGLLTVLALFLSLQHLHKYHFAFTQVEQMAQKRAAGKYETPADVLPPQLKKLTPPQEAGIFWKDTYRLWKKKGLPFQMDFYHQLKSNPSPHISPLFNTVDRKGAHALGYSPSYFNYNNLSFDPPLPDDLGYAGFYARYPINQGNSLDGFFSALGASYFRVLARDQVYGLSARGLAINSQVNGKAEEFPNFVQWWLHEPDPAATDLVLDALLDSPSVAGAFGFKIHPGSVTSVDVHASLYFRQAVDQLGIAPFSSMYLYGENAKDHFNNNAHPEVHDSDGFLLDKGNGEWVWRPLEQGPHLSGRSAQLQVYSFGDENPKGFGLLQRDRDFQHYQDLESKYNVRPSAWVVPRGNWGKGEFVLINLPSNDFNTDNIALFWHPAQPVKAGDHLEFTYTINFYMNDAALPPLALCKQTLVNDPAPPPPPPPAPLLPVIPAAPPATNSKGSPTAIGKNAPAPKPLPVLPPPSPPGPTPPTGTTPVQFVVDFTGNGIERLPASQVPHLELSLNPPGTFLRESKVEKNDFDHLWRVTFTIIPLKHNVPTELLCHLSRDGKPLTETWSYTWHQ